MKKLSTIILAFAIGATSFAQNDVILKQKEHLETEPQQIQSLFGRADSHGFYLSSGIAYTTVNRYDAITIGGRMVYIADHAFAFGIGGQGFFTEPKADQNINDGLDFYSFGGGYGGFIFEPILAGRSPIHLSFPILVGAGGIAYFRGFTNSSWQQFDNADGWDSADWNWEENEDYNFEQNDILAPRPFLVVKPSVELEMNLFKHFRIAFSTSYRATTDINMKYPDGSSIVRNKKPLNGISYGVVFKMGIF